MITEKCERNGCENERLEGYVICQECHKDWVRLGDEADDELYEKFIKTQPRVRFIFR